MAGLSSLYRMGDPLNVRLTGIVINQPDLPWWGTAILNWIGMVQTIQQATGDLGKSYQGLLEHVLEQGGTLRHTNEKTGRTVNLSGPAAVYGLYQSYCLRLQQESQKRR